MAGEECNMANVQNNKNARDKIYTMRHTERGLSLVSAGAGGAGMSSATITDLHRDLVLGRGPRGHDRSIAHVKSRSESRWSWTRISTRRDCNWHCPLSARYPKARARKQSVSAGRDERFTKASVVLNSRYSPLGCEARRKGHDCGSRCQKHEDKTSTRHCHRRF